VRIGIGLPLALAGLDRTSLLAWMRAAEAVGFASISAIDRLVHRNWEPLVALAAAAAATERVELVTSILIPGYRTTAVVAKQVATLDRLTGERLVLGLGLGGRDDDYDAAGRSGCRTGRRLEEQIGALRRIWAGEGGIGPPPRPGGPPILLAGFSATALERAGRLGDGWIMGVGAPDGFVAPAAAVRAAWAGAGRSGEPRLAAMASFALGPAAPARVAAALGSYYEPGLAAWIGERAAVTPATVAAYVEGFARAGCHDLLWQPCDPDPGEVLLLAAACGVTA
jgi:alkanesulfonate monooxygenase SsuD/methylene tetrahydromethanopterin reductase-like flavin-dependent oxidoreductase (luciferase family)